LYTVEGTTKGKLPYLLASHLDVVPVDPSTWEVPPFSGRIINRTYVYGRGAIDDKSGVLVSTAMHELTTPTEMSCTLLSPKVQVSLPFQSEFVIHF
jgi:acetylornithine deacetylase/succinyl-diaminopimelate desuccinylase-like protein